jgi:Metallo-peptidase family M12B Reprolysin-like
MEYGKIGTSFVSLIKGKLKFCGSCLVEKDNFWAAYITDQWQYVDWHDWDSFSESSDLIKLLPPKQALSCPLGRSLGYASNQNMDVGGDISIIFNQTHSDGLMNSIDKFYTVAHEIGHQFGLEDHNAWRPIPNTGLMSAALNVDTPSTDLYFVPWHLNLLRLRSSSPGK